MKRTYSPPMHPSPPSPSTSHKAARVSPTEPLSGSESHRGLSTRTHVEQASYAKMEVAVESDLSTTSSTNQRSMSKQPTGYDPAVYEDDDGNIKYNPSEEPPPKIPLHHPSFFLAEGLASQIPAEILDVIEQSGCDSEGVTYIRDHADHAKIIGTPDDVIIGFIGDSGTGKSSVINSLLGIEDIAPSGNDGACTAVVQEFRKPHQFQETPYQSEIVFFDPPTRNTMLREWVTDFWDCEEANADVSDDGFADDVDRASTAATALSSLFCDHAECQDIEKTRTFLQTATVRGDPALMAKLQTWTESLLSKNRVKNDRLIYKSHTPGDLQEKVAVYMQHRMNNQESVPSPWPLVKIIRTFLHAPLLAQGIILADLPGLSDVNQTRVRATKNYSKTLQYTVVVSNISRARTDSATQTYLLDAFKQKRGPCVCMVVTHSESLLSTSGYLKDCMNRASPDDKKTLSRLDDQLKETTSRFNNIKRKITESRKRRDTDAKDALDREMKELKFKQVAQKIKLSEACVETRNRRTAEEMSKRYSPHMRGTDLLPVFCVSNSVYAQNIEGYDSDNPPSIGVHATGIPGFRASLLCLPARKKFQAFKLYRQHKLPSLLNSIRIALSDNLLKEKEELQTIILTAQDSIPGEIESLFRHVLTHELLVVIGKIETNKLSYAERAQSKPESWSDWRWNTYKAFTNNSGNYESKRYGHTDWNGEMLEGLVKNLESEARHWDNSSIGLTKALARSADGFVDALVTKLKAKSKLHPDALQPFLSKLHLLKDYLQEKCKALAEDFERELIAIRDCIFETEDAKESYFVGVMQEAYDRCVGITGSGSHKARCAILMAHVSDTAQGPFQKVHDIAEAKAQEFIREYTKKLSDEFQRAFQSFHRAFMLGFRNEEYDPPDLKALRTNLHLKLPTWKAKLLEIDHHLAECEEFGSQ